MRKSLLLSVALVLGMTTLVEAQLREDVVKPMDLTGAVIKTDQPRPTGGLMDMLNMKMSHSYSMTFGSVGGQYQNLNAYTNHMTFGLSEKLTGRLDVSLLHSPFGSSFMNTGSHSMGSRIIIDRAQLDYQFSPNSSLSIQFSQRPYYSPFGYMPGTFSGRNYIGY